MGEARADSTGVRIEVDLVAVICSVHEGSPSVVVVGGGEGESDPGGAGDQQAQEGLPAGSLDPIVDRTLELGMRRWVRERTGIELGYLEQLYTFGDRDRARRGDERVLSIVYLALQRDEPLAGGVGPRWRSCYDYLPWEDRRAGVPSVVTEQIAPALSDWAESATEPELRVARAGRIASAFGPGGGAFDPGRALDRYELLYEAGLVPESTGRSDEEVIGRPMRLDHRRILATALERVRGKLSWRPVIFELLPDVFTLGQLQAAVEALTGSRLHKSNFRRLIEQSKLVEGTGRTEVRTGGRPAELFRFRREVLRERPAPGVVPPSRRR
jgi:hypothetical protein